MKNNLWNSSATILGNAYDHKARPERFAVVTRVIVDHVRKIGSLRVLDIGGGYGAQAIDLARLGHFVCILDSDPDMLERARQRSTYEPQEIQQRITFICGEGENAVELCGGEFDIVCCHSVLLYIKDINGILDSLCKSVKTGGIASILHLNNRALAMRAGLQGNWSEALGYLSSREHLSDDYINGYRHNSSKIIEILKKNKLTVQEISGVGIFTDHRNDLLTGEDLKKSIEVEFISGKKEPYRSIARNWHFVARKL